MNLRRADERTVKKRTRPAKQMPYEEGITGEKGLQLIAQLDLQVEIGHKSINLHSNLRHVNHIDIIKVSLQCEAAWLRSPAARCYILQSSAIRQFSMGPAIWPQFWEAVPSSRPSPFRQVGTESEM